MFKKLKKNISDDSVEMSGGNINTSNTSRMNPINYSNLNNPNTSNVIPRTTY
jgi:hypothetical protein